MKTPVLETLRQVVSAVVCAYPGGREGAAARLGFGLKQFDNRVYENAGSRPLSYDQIQLLEQDAKTTHLPEFIARLYGGMFVPLTKTEELDNVELYQRSLKSDAKLGLIDQLIHAAIDDGVIDPTEAMRIIQALTCYMAARTAEVAATIQLYSPSNVRGRK
ncbi:YmfL family putative regulatory protein [Pseudomonas sp. NBRC 111118]|uniref:YmfL family putative regulatory protein n=1 Tax=Pseudomonas sp. NBRC 111118 TaxID=1661033 RepID=UPI0006D43C58|nr:YmfL family putative regulatory protein [Pseudomonas sp. NBRC 111118]